MSKIEVCSRHIGPITVTTRQGDVKDLVFKDCSTDDRKEGVAEVDEDVALVLLEDIGLPDYYKSGPVVIKANPGPADDPGGGSDDDPPPAGGLTKESYETISNANTLKKALKGCADKGLLMELMAGETQGKNRETFVNALNAQIEALA